MQDPQTLPLTPLDDAALQALDTLLENLSERDEEAPNLWMACGYITALCLVPGEHWPKNWTTDLLGEAATDSECSDFVGLVKPALAAIQQGLYLGQGIDLPFDPEATDDLDLASDWCCGFMLSVFNLPLQDADSLAELLLPLMALSGLFEDEAEVAELMDNESLMQSFAAQLPELLLDIYCQLNAPEEKPQAPSSKRKTRRAGRT